MTDDQINHMVTRFLTWPLPETFAPDGGVYFEPVANKGTYYEYHHHPVGTNVLTAVEAEAMVRHMLEGLPEPIEHTANEEARHGNREALEQAPALIELLAPMLDDEPSLDQQIAGRKALAEWRGKCG